MLSAFKRYWTCILALAGILTTLFVFAIAAPAAKATADVNAVPSAGDCTTIEMLISPDKLAAFETQGGKLVKLDAAQSKDVLKALTEEFGPPPFEPTYIYVIDPGKEVPAVKLAFFTEQNCFLGTGTFPKSTVFLAITGQKAAQ